MTVVRITIKKSLISGTYAYRHSIVGAFATEYVVRTSASFLSDQLDECAKNIAQAESRIYYDCVRFDKAIVKLATPGASGEELRGQFSHVGLDDLRGQLKKPAEEPMAYPPVAAVFGRQTNGGRHGRLILPFALTTSEWNLYTHNRVLPLRFQKTDDVSASLFDNDLFAAIQSCSGTYVMAGSEEDTSQSLRTIWNFFFSDFQVSSLKTKRKKSSATAKKAAARRALLQSEEAGIDSSSAKTSRIKVSTPGLVYMLQAGQHFKIGMTINLDKRLTQIKLQLPFAATLVHTIKAANPSQAESHWHRRFASLRLNGEWFALSPAEVNEFKNVSEM